eukprot:6113847-Pyramimonas_sp.AAC.1
MTTASRLSPKVHLALQYLIRNFFRILSVDSARLANSIISYLQLLILTAARWFIATATQIQDSTTTNEKATKPQAGFDQDMSEFEDLADTPTPEGATREASRAEPEHHDGRLSTIYEESGADLESHVMEV